MNLATVAPIWRAASGFCRGWTAGLSHGRGGLGHVLGLQAAGERGAEQRVLGVEVG